MAENYPDTSKLTARVDLWWIKPVGGLMVILGLVAYLTWAASIGDYFTFGPYTSPIYTTPVVPSWWVLSPAFLLLWIPIGLRLTCYYGRKVYYRSIFADPANCAVGEPYRQNYKGETKFPFVLMNIHRYFLYLAVVLMLLHWYEFVEALFHEGSVYLGLGTFIILVDTVALTLYVLSCHSLRHLLGGGRRRFGSKAGYCPSCETAGYKVWKNVSVLNHLHSVWFWISLFSIALADFYIRLLSRGALPFDPHFILL